MKKQQNKVRDMKGVRPGVGSAGRAHKNWAEKQPTPDSFEDVGKSCTQFFKSRGMRWGSFQMCR